MRGRWRERRAAGPGGGSSTLLLGSARHCSAWHGMAWHSMAQHGMAQLSLAQHGTARLGMAQCSLAHPSSAQLSSAHLVCTSNGPQTPRPPSHPWADLPALLALCPHPAPLHPRMANAPQNAMRNLRKCQRLRCPLQPQQQGCPAPWGPDPATGPAGVERFLERGQEEKTNLLFFGNYEVTNDQ